MSAHPSHPIINEQEEEAMTFWEHLDVLRSSIIRMLFVVAVTTVVAFFFKDTLFNIVLAPSKSDFITYKLMGAEPFSLQLVNIGLTEQFMIHLKTACCFGVIIAAPFILYLLYQFIRPALYTNERKYTLSVVGSSYVMFIVGTIVDYFIIFPLTVRFLGTYSVSQDVQNMLSLQSYMDTLLMMSLVFGIIFELPVISWLLTKFGIIKPQWMKKYRRHAIVAILIIAAIITPTADIFTLCIVSLPIWVLYEASILICAHTQARTNA